MGRLSISRGALKDMPPTRGSYEGHLKEGGVVEGPHSWASLLVPTAPRRDLGRTCLTKRQSRRVISELSCCVSNMPTCPSARHHVHHEKHTNNL